MTDMPFIPEFREAKERNKWIVDHAEYFTTFYRRQYRGNKQPHPTFELAEQAAQRIIQGDPNIRVLIYAVYGMHDTLTATISTEGTKRHE